MQVFYATEIDDNRVRLDKSEHKHITRALRKKEGDVVAVADGRGNIYDVHLDKISPSEIFGSIKELVQSEPKVVKSISVAMAPTKNASRFEWFLEKATEIGIDHIYPIITKHSERRKINLERCQRIIQSAFTQSQRLWIPEITDVIPFEQFIQKEANDIRLIAHYNPIHKNLDQEYDHSSVTVLIGPEGDFSESEYQKAIDCGYKGINLGNNRLRTETAGIVAVSQLVYLRTHS